jgi:hypothetical protein
MLSQEKGITRAEGYLPPESTAGRRNNTETSNRQEEFASAMTLCKEIAETNDRKTRRALKRQLKQVSNSLADAANLPRGAHHKYLLSEANQRLGEEHFPPPYKKASQKELQKRDIVEMYYLFGVQPNFRFKRLRPFFYANADSVSSIRDNLSQQAAKVAKIELGLLNNEFPDFGIEAKYTNANIGLAKDFLNKSLQEISEIVPRTDKSLTALPSIDLYKQEKQKLEKFSAHEYINQRINFLQNEQDILRELSQVPPEFGRIDGNRRFYKDFVYLIENYPDIPLALLQKLQQQYSDTYQNTEKIDTWQQRTILRFSKLRQDMQFIHQQYGDPRAFVESQYNTNITNSEIISTPLAIVVQCHSEEEFAKLSRLIGQSEPSAANLGGMRSDRTTDGREFRIILLNSQTEERTIKAYRHEYEHVIQTLTDPIPTNEEIRTKRRMLGLIEDPRAQEKHSAPTFEVLLRQLSENSDVELQKEAFAYLSSGVSTFFTKDILSDGTYDPFMFSFDTEGTPAESITNFVQRQLTPEEKQQLKELRQKHYERVIPTVEVLQKAIRNNLRIIDIVGMLTYYPPRYWNQVLTDFLEYNNARNRLVKTKAS